MPGGTWASWAALPDLAWLQIVLVFALLDNSILAQKPENVATRGFSRGVSRSGEATVNQHGVKKSVTHIGFTVLHAFFVQDYVVSAEFAHRFFSS